MQTQDFYSDLAQLDLHSLFSNFNFKLEVPLFQGFDYKKKKQTMTFFKCQER